MKNLLIFLSFISKVFSSEYINTLEFNKEDIRINVGESDSFKLFLSNHSVIHAFNVTIDCDPKKCKTFDPNFPKVEFFGDQIFGFNITGLSAGHDVIVAKVLDNYTFIDVSETFIRIRVGRSAVWAIMAQVVGWIYFFIWSASFWPQNITNFRRKSVVGFNLDFAALNVTGFCFYAIFNSGLYFSPIVQSEYEKQFPRSEIPVELNDVIYAYHAVLATGISLVQCYIYERGDQRMSLLGKLFTGVTWTAAGIQLVLCFTRVMSWLTFLYYFSYVKLIVTSVKYLPQAWFNYKRKSTRGWSIAMIYMDITGGINGLLQMIFIAYNFNDWKTIFGNFAKFGLSLASISYDIIFFLQEYVFYPKSGSSLQPLEAERRYSRKESRKSVVSIVSVKSDHFMTEKSRKSIISIESIKSEKSFKNSFLY